MKATLQNLTDVPVTFGGQTLTAAAQPVRCVDPLPAPVADQYLLVAACLGPSALARSDVVWSSTIPHCEACAPAPTKRRWFAKLTQHQAAMPALQVIEHCTPEDGWQGVGTEFFRQRYLV